jgi:hypothetical protein
VFQKSEKQLVGRKKTLGDIGSHPEAAAFFLLNDTLTSDKSFLAQVNEFSLVMSLSLSSFMSSLMKFANRRFIG